MRRTTSGTGHGSPAGAAWPQVVLPVCLRDGGPIWCAHSQRFTLEVEMRTTALLAMLALATVAACAKPAPAPEPAPAVSTEPTYTGKYK
jgi:hypothetical protein